MAKDSKQGQEHVFMMLKTLASHSLSKKVALLPQPAGVHGQAAPQPAIAVFRQGLEHVLTILQTPTMTRKLTKKVATSKNAAMTLGQHGVYGIHAPIVVRVGCPLKRFLAINSVGLHRPSGDGRDGPSKSKPDVSNV